MAGLTYAKAEIVSLKDHPDYQEKWVRDRIVEDPAILGLGDLSVRDVEHVQPKSGRLDLLLADSLDQRRFEVELMLGGVDESHVIRAIEYWDKEKKRHPQYEHCTVLVAEQITDRYLNILGLFNRVIPIIAIQMTALRVGEYLVLQFSTVLEEIRGGLPYDEEEQSGAERRSREERATDLSSATLSECLSIMREINPAIALDYRRDYVSLSISGRLSECLTFFLQRDFVGVKGLAGNKQEWLFRLQKAGFVVLSGGALRKKTHFRLTMEQVREQRPLLKEFFKDCFQERAQAAGSAG